MKVGCARGSFRFGEGLQRGQTLSPDHRDYVQPPPLSLPPGGHKDLLQVGISAHHCMIISFQSGSLYHCKLVSFGAVGLGMA